jgi:hypothetical protein
MSFSAMPHQFFNDFHALFQGDTYHECHVCGGCEYTLLAALLPGESDYIAGRLDMKTDAFRNKYIDTIVVNEQPVETIRTIVPCPFLETSGRCSIKTFKPVLCELYPLVLVQEGATITAEIDPWCPLSRQKETVQAFKDKWNLVKHLFQDLDREWLQSLETFDAFTYDTGLLEEKRRTPPEKAVRLQLETVLKCKSHHVAAEEAFALYSHGHAWKRLSGTILHYVQSEFPGPICRHARLMMESKDIKVRIDSLIKASESIAMFSAYLLLGQYIRDLRNGAVTAPDNSLNIDIQRKLVRLSFGTLVGFARDLASIYVHNDMQHFVQELPKAWVSQVSSYMSDIVEVRNALQHHKLTLTGKNGASVFQDNFEKFMKITHAMSFLRHYAIVSPIEKYGHSADLLVSRGTGQNLLFWQDAALLSPFELNEVYLLNLKTNELISLYPFYRKGLDPITGETKIFIAEGRDDNKVHLIDEIDAHNITIPLSEFDFPQFLQPLSPDYKFQVDNYLQGYRLRIVNHERTHEIINSFGDLKSSESLKIQKIKSDVFDAKPQDDMFMFDYHDCPDFPIDDDTFCLTMSIDGQAADESNIVKEIWNPGFRKFGINLKTTMPLAHFAQIEASMFEPELMNLSKVDVSTTPTPIHSQHVERSDYYELNAALPTEQLDFRLVFPAGYTPANAILEHSGAGIVEIGKHLRELTVSDMPDGRKMLTMRLHRPKVDDVYIVRYNLRGPASVTRLGVDLSLFQAGKSIYEFMLTKGHNQKWEVSASEQGIVLIPKDKSDESKH